MTLLRLKRKLWVLGSKSGRRRSRHGLTLFEMAIAIGLVSTVIVMILSSVSGSLQLQSEADRMSVAVALAQTKLSQLMSRPNLTTSHNKGNFGSNAGMYAGYEFEIDVREDRINLAEVAQSGKLQGTPVSDQLPAGVQNQGETQKAGQTVATQTGGEVDIVRIVVLIRFPRGQGLKGTYRVETFRRSQKTVQSEAEL